MRSELNLKIDGVVRKERIRKVFLGSLLLIFILFLGFFTAVKIPSESTTVLGVVNSYHADQHYIGTTIHLIIQLPNIEELATIELPKSESIELGKTVQMIECKSFLFDYKWYSFVKYVD